MIRSILVAEDERPLATAMQLKFASEGYKVTVVSNGQEALDALAKDSFDVLLLDLVMPVVDGFTVLEKIGVTKPDMHIIVISNLGQEEDRARVAALGIRDYYVKSDTTIAEIVNRVNLLLAHGTAE